MTKLLLPALVFVLGLGSVLPTQAFQTTLANRRDLFLPTKDHGPYTEMWRGLRRSEGKTLYKGRPQDAKLTRSRLWRESYRRPARPFFRRR
ncbi:MAG: hypothetical protein ACFCU3_10025 [Verrucomicrobiales bacterium]